MLKPSSSRKRGRGLTPVEVKGEDGRVTLYKSLIEVRIHVAIEGKSARKKRTHTERKKKSEKIKHSRKLKKY